MELESLTLSFTLLAKCERVLPDFRGSKGASPRADESLAVVLHLPQATQ